MARADVSAAAVSARLLRTAQLRELCLALRQGVHPDRTQAWPLRGLEDAQLRVQAREEPGFRPSRRARPRFSL
jgi:hypothetical protein